MLYVLYRYNLCMCILITSSILAVHIHTLYTSYIHLYVRSLYTHMYTYREFFGFSPNVISFTTAIKSCEAHGDWQGALEIFSLMKAVGVLPNERTYACMISAASRGLAADVAINILNEMALNDYPPNMICYSGTLTACARCGMW